MMGMRIFARMTGPDAYKRRLTCPAEGLLAAYVDQTIGNIHAVKVQRHLSKCAYCRHLVADVVRLQRINDQENVPPAVLARVRQLFPAAPKRRGWWLMPLTAAGALACIVLTVTLLHTEQDLKTPVSPTPTAPEISKSASPRFLEPNEVYRGSTSPQQGPIVTSPVADSVLAPNRLEFRWKPVPHAVYYQVRVVTSEGELVWQSDTTANLIKIQDRLALQSGKYFVLVSAVMENGRTKKFDPLRFRVSGAQ